MYFDELPLDDTVLDALDAMNFEECTPIQEQAIPPLLEGHDLIGVAQTGTGKTAAYLLPILNELATGQYPQDSINCLIMAPTRELAQQIDRQVEGFAYFMPFSSVAVYGGNDGIRYEQERRGLTLGADIIIATPGRLISHLTTGKIDFSRVSFFILDEADRMLDMGFYDDIMTIVRQLPKDRQTILFSATMPPKIRQMAKAIMRNPVEVQIAVSRPPESIHQMCARLYEAQKPGFVQLTLAGRELKKVIVFAGKKQRVKDLTRTLRTLKIDARAMHSDLEQSERDQVMLDFRNGKVDVLVATDVVSRGIDVTDVPLVINYDVPHAPEDYVHRIGRTARAENCGEAITLVSPEDARYWHRVEQFLKKEIERLPLPDALGDAPTNDVYATRSGRGCSGGSRHSSRNRGGHPHRSKGPNRGAHRSSSKPRF